MRSKDCRVPRLDGVRFQISSSELKKSVSVSLFGISSTGPAYRPRRIAKIAACVRFFAPILRRIDFT